MANLPTAHASQTFGHKSVDFYAAPGQVVGSDPRARADERRIQDVDGARHAVRLSEGKYELSPGDLAAVLRVQPGPSRKSRPVAVINYTGQSWTRTQPDAGAVLAKAGVARNLNWLASVLFLLAVILAVLWPELRAFALELFPASLGAWPGFDVFALATSALPDLAGWRLTGSAAPLAGALEQTVPALSGYATVLMYALGVILGTIIAFAARSWRLLWMPALAAAIGVGAIGLAGPSGAAIPAALALAGVLAFFLAGGAINRARDGWRLEQRIARLADYLLRHPPEEMVAPAGAAAHANAGTMMSEPEAGTEVEVAPGAETPVQPRQTATAVAAAEAARTAQGGPALKAHTTSEPDETHASAQGADEAAAADGAEPAEPGIDETGADETAADSFVASAEPAPPPHEQTEEETAEPDAEVQADGAKAGEERAAERREDPRHDARDISLPPPPPMPKPAQTLKPDAPLQAENPSASGADDRDETQEERS